MSESILRIYIKSGFGKSVLKVVLWI